MKKILILLISLIYFTVSVDAQIGGISTYKFLDLVNSARVSALGGANVSIKDPNLIFNNPAIMDSTTSNYLNVSYISYYADINWGYSSYTFSPSKPGNFAVGIQYINYGKFVSANELGEKTGDFTAADYALNIAWSKQLDSFFSVGVILKPLYSKYETYTSYGIASDIGILYLSRNKNFSAGLVFRNMGRQITPYTANNFEPLPFDIQLGISQRLSHAPFRFSLVAHHLNTPDIGYTIPETQDNTQSNMDKKNKSKLEKNGDLFLRHFIASVEIIPSKNFYLSFGFNYQRRQELKIAEKTGLTGISAGLGIKIKRFNFNYGIAKYHLVGSTHNFTLSLNLSNLRN